MALGETFGILVGLVVGSFRATDQPGGVVKRDLPHRVLGHSRERVTIFCVADPERKCAIHPGEDENQSWDNVAALDHGCPLTKNRREKPLSE